MFFFMVFFNLLQFTLWAQEEGKEESKTTTTSSSKTEISLENTGSEWYTSPWVWIVGAAVFILLLVALLSPRGSSSDRVIVKKTVERDADNTI